MHLQIPEQVGDGNELALQVEKDSAYRVQPAENLGA